MIMIMCTETTEKDRHKKVKVQKLNFENTFQIRMRIIKLSSRNSRQIRSMCQLLLGKQMYSLKVVYICYDTLNAEKMCMI